MLHTIRCWLTFIFITIIFGSLGVLFALLDKSRVSRLSIRPWGKYMLKGCGIELEVKGIEHLYVQPSIIMYNHQSVFDIFAFCAVVPVEWKAVMKSEVASIPCIGWVSRLTGQYFVARDGSSGDLSQVKKICDKIRNGPSVLIAPEGTRSEDGNLLPFKKGGFVIALRSGVPVIPMIITGGYNLKVKNSYKINSGTMKVTILEPINLENMGRGRVGREKLESIVRERMINVLKQNNNADVIS